MAEEVKENGGLGVVVSFLLYDTIAEYPFHPDQVQYFLL